MVGCGLLMQACLEVAHATVFAGVPDSSQLYCQAERSGEDLSHNVNTWAAALTTTSTVRPQRERCCSEFLPLTWRAAPNSIEHGELSDNLRSRESYAL
jgi:hypothetical protein